MAKKPIKQYATLTDDSGADALSVATGGAVTVGVAAGTQTHIVNGALQVVTATHMIRSKGIGNDTTDYIGLEVLPESSTTNGRGFFGLADATNGWVQGAARGDVLVTAKAHNFIVSCNDGSTIHGKCTTAGAWANISGGSWGTISDERLKKNISPLSNGLSIILALKPVSYEWRDENVSKLRPTTHFIAQEVELVNPGWVIESGSEKITENGVEVEIENCKQVSLDASFNAYLVKAIQEQQAIIEDLKTRLAAIEAKP
jgi:hypothetical protein